MGTVYTIPTGHTCCVAPVGSDGGERRLRAGDHRVVCTVRDDRPLAHGVRAGRRGEVHRGR
ncbi:type II toxin-antitoxin system RelE family toxin [Streptomyces sp. WMMC897]|uniref:type II toxin-antitoxin system RelE family toxin n=1 Tax=Streptomyces sp. WMMC897 TaxID=3014782 RepID=UPI0022B74CEC|nr:hypothetical protein [Streptomyces sp. WMMC897]MCZ7414948.1 hypothetical protein [Streptomyces sp. WMMC897]